MCGILFLTEGSGQPQLSRVFQDVPKRRALSNTASHTGLSPSHAEIVARFCLCGMFVLGLNCIYDGCVCVCVCVSLRLLMCGQAHRYTCALKVTAQLQRLASKKKPACVFRDFIGSCYPVGSIYCMNPLARVHV